MKGSDVIVFFLNKLLGHLYVLSEIMSSRTIAMLW